MIPVVLCRELKMVLEEISFPQSKVSTETFKHVLLLLFFVDDALLWHQKDSILVYVPVQFELPGHRINSVTCGPQAVTEARVTAVQNSWSHWEHHCPANHPDDQPEAFVFVRSNG